MDERQWVRDYFERFLSSLAGAEAAEQIVALKGLFEEARQRGGKVIFVGNGGSASIASHCAVDFTKNAGLRCVNFNEADLITCLANDHGYEQWVEKALEMYADECDVAVLISSSGKSPNMVRAGRYASARGLVVVTLTGFAPDNPLRKLGTLNFWVDSREYNVVEMTHHIWLLAVCDLMIERSACAPNRDASHAVPH